jgi:quinoprotein glucose dehydrogenase
VTENDLIDFTPELAAEAREIASWHKLGPLFTPPVVSTITGPLGTLMAPSQNGGTNWPGGAFDPETGLLYVPASGSLISMGLTAPYPGQSEMAYIQGNALTGPRTSGGSGSGVGGARAEFVPAEAREVDLDPTRGEPRLDLSVQGLPLLKPPYGTITAIDMHRGDIAWQIAHGETPDEIRNHPALAGLDLPRTGQDGSPGILVTKTLVISGEPSFTTTIAGTRGAMLRAYDKANGVEVGAVYLPAPQTGSPMTYALDGRQYLVVAVSGGSYSGELIAFVLPQ